MTAPPPPPPGIPGAAPQAAAQTMNIAPMAQAQNPFAWLAGQLRASWAQIPPGGHDAVREAIVWLEYLAPMSAGLQSNDPVILLACARAATHATHRQTLRAALDVVDAALPATPAAPAAAPPPAPPPEAP